MSFFFPGMGGPGMGGFPGGHPGAEESDDVCNVCMYACINK